MKAMKKILAVLLTLTLVAALIPAAFAENDGHTVTINNSVNGYEYKIFQIFTGELDEEGTLSNIVWGDDITPEGQAALYTRYELTEDEDKTAAKVAEKIVEEDNARALAGFLKTKDAGYLGSGTVMNNYTATGLADGYYFIENTDVPTVDGVYSDYIVKVVKNVTVAPKSDKPTVDKQVQDEAADKDANSNDTVNGWGETADHSLYEKYQYKLIATMPADAANNLDAYDSYKLVFHDTLSAGITFAGNVAVTVTNPKENTTVAYTLSNNVETASDSNPVDGALEWTLEIADLKQYVTTLHGTVVTVTYDAWLNEDCVIGNSNDNKNDVYLEYSNNPNTEGTGHTAPDTVYTFTYTMPNKKVDEDNAVLEGAGFRLYTDVTCANEVELIKVEDDAETFYRPVKAGETAEEMFSLEDGTFNIKGLDAGTYYLKETTTPQGYNTCDIVTVVISATHSETATGASTSISMTMDGNTSTENVIQNQKGSTLPETGGIGTTLFYVFGSILVIGAGVLLVSKKRMGAAE